MSREDEWKRISEMAGVDEDGGILPPPPGLEIDRSPSPFWKTYSGYDVLKLESKDKP